MKNSEIRELNELLNKNDLINSELRLIELLEKKRLTIISNKEAINQILAKPRINFVRTQFDESYNDTGYNDVQDPQPGGGYRDYSQWIDNIVNPVLGGYNDVQDPQPGGGYRDYSQWIDRFNPNAGGYNDIQDPQPGGGYVDYTDQIEDFRRNFSGYNDGPQDPLSLALVQNILKNETLVNRLREKGLLKEYISLKLELQRNEKK